MRWPIAAVVSVLTFCCLACGNHGNTDAKGRPAAGRKTQVLGAPEAGELRIDPAASKVSLAIAGGVEPGSRVDATLGVRQGSIMLTTARVPAARFSIDLTTFDSHLPLRNDRVKTYFFETATAGYDTAEIVVQKLPEDALAKLRDKKLVAGVKVDAELTISGRTFTIPMTIDAGYSERGNLWVKTSAPLELNIVSLGMHDKRRKLVQICQHDKIEDVVKAEASLEFSAR